MPYLDNTGVEHLVGDLKEKTDAAYQATLVSGTNIKTVNGSSILGSGDLTIDGGATTTWYGTSSTAAGTAAKVVICAGFELVKGAIISVLFSQQNTVGSLTMNVNSTGAVGVRISATSINTTSNSLKWAANTLVTFIYDGTYFEYISARNVASSTSTDGSGSWYGTSSTTATTATKTCSSTTMLTYRLTPGAVVHIKFSNANTYVAGALSLNISSTGVYDIWVNNAVTSSSNTLTWDAGEVLTFVYGDSAYHFVCKSKAEAYTLPTASTTTLGGVKVDGSTVTIDSNGTISAAVSGGVSVTTTTVTIAASDWSNNTCTKNVTGVTASNDVLVTYAPASKAAYIAADVYCTAQGAGTLTFGCTTTPTEAITVNVMIFEGGGVTPEPETYYVHYDPVSFTVTGYESDSTGYVAELTGDTVEVTVNDLSPARPGQTAPTYTFNVGSTQGASDITSFNGLSINDRIRSFIMPACDVYLSVVKE